MYLIFLYLHQLFLKKIKERGEEVNEYSVPKPKEEGEEKKQYNNKKNYKQREGGKDNRDNRRVETRPVVEKKELDEDGFETVSYEKKPKPKQYKQYSNHHGKWENKPKKYEKKPKNDVNENEKAFEESLKKDVLPEDPTEDPTEDAKNNENYEENKENTEEKEVDYKEYKERLKNKENKGKKNDKKKHQWTDDPVEDAKVEEPKPKEAPTSVTFKPPVILIL